MKETKFNTQKEAETMLAKKIKEEKQDRYHIFCPLCRERCTVICECWMQAKISHSSNLFQIYPGYCDCTLLHGD